MKFTIIIVYLLLSPLSIASAANQTIKIALGEWPPYISKKANDSGPIARLIKDIFYDEGYKIEYEFLPWTRAYKLTSRGKYDAMAIWMMKEERKEKFWYSNEVLTERFTIFHLKETTVNTNTLKEINLGVNLGYKYGDIFDKYMKDNKITPVSSVIKPSQNFMLLLNKRIDAFPMEKNVGYDTLANLESKIMSSKITHTNFPQLFKANGSFLLFSKEKERNLELLKLFNNRLDIYKNSGKYYKYFIE
jgi:polar amino acid transport system substrate-binding protein